MGIQGLLPFVKKATKKTHIRNYSGLTAAVDGYGWLYKGAFGCAVKLGLGEPTDQYVRYVMKHIEVLISNGVRPVIVFDGRSLPAKEITNKKRREARVENRQKAVSLTNKGDKKGAWEYFIKSLEVTHEMVQDVIKELRKAHIDYIVAPYEADAQLAYLSRNGIVDVVITEDSDLVVFGVKKALFKFKVTGDCVEYDERFLHKSLDVSFEKFEFEKFRQMCILSGCDYLESLPGVGLTRAKKFIMYATTIRKPVPEILDLIPAHLKLDIEVPEDYVQQFKEAENSFLYQIVFDPRSRKLVPLSPYPASVNPDDMKYAGVYDVTEEIAYHLAVGNIHTKTLKRLNTYDIDKDKGYQSTTTSIWSRNFTSNGSSIGDKLTRTTKHTSTNGLTTTVTLKSVMRKRQLDVDGKVAENETDNENLMNLYKDKGGKDQNENVNVSLSPRKSKKAKMNLRENDFHVQMEDVETSPSEMPMEDSEQNIDAASPRLRKPNPFAVQKSPDLGLAARKIFGSFHNSVAGPRRSARNQKNSTEEQIKTEPLIVVKKNHVYNFDDRKLVIKSQKESVEDLRSSQETNSTPETGSSSCEASQVSIYSLEKGSLPETESQLLEDMLLNSKLDSDTSPSESQDVITIEEDVYHESSYFGKKILETRSSSAIARRSPRNGLISGKLSQRSVSKNPSPANRTQASKRFKVDAKQRSVMDMFSKR